MFIIIAASLIINDTINYKKKFNFKSCLFILILGSVVILGDLCIIQLQAFLFLLTDFNIPSLTNAYWAEPLPLTGASNTFHGVENCVYNSRDTYSEIAECSLAVDADILENVAGILYSIITAAITILFSNN